MGNHELEHLGIRVPRQLNQKIAEAINRGEYATKSELVRTALKALFKEEGF